jgi:hypothetical protein
MGQNMQKVQEEHTSFEDLGIQLARHAGNMLF